MGDKGIIIADLVAGLLIGIQFLLASEQHERIDRKLLKKIGGDLLSNGHLKLKTMMIPGSLTTLVMLGIIIHGTVIDLVKGALSTGEILLSAVSLVGGTVIGIGILILTVWLHRKVSFFRKLNPIAVVITVGMLMGILSLTVFVMVAGKVSVHVIALVAAFSVGVMLMAAWTGGMKYIQRYLTFRSGVLIRLGILVFIGGKAFQLIYM